MAANECIPTKTPALTVTGQATATVTGKRFVKISAPRVGGGLAGGTSVISASGPGYTGGTLSADTVDTYQIAPCGTSGEAVLGVAGQDCAVGQVVTVYKRGPGHILPVKSGANITAGQEVQTDASGQAIPLAAGRPAGYAVDSASSGNDVEIVLY